MRYVELDGIPLARPRLRWRDLAREAALSVLGHPARSLLTGIGIALGAAAFVATLGLSSTMSRQVADSFDVRRATEVVVHQPDRQQRDGSRAVPPWQSPEALDRLRRLRGVDGVGARLALPEQPVARAAGLVVQRFPITGLDPAAFAVIEPRLALGRTFDAFHDRRADPVALLPHNIADALGVRRVGVAIVVNGRPFTVIGIVDDVQREPGTLASIVVPFSTAQSLVGTTRDAVPVRDVLVKVVPGAAELIGDQAPRALVPEAPDRVESIVPPDPRTLRRELEGTVTEMAVILSIAALIIGAASVANAASAGVAARMPEIGLRRAVGALSRHIFVQLMAETAAVGGVCGLLGAAAGVAATVAVSVAEGWQPVVDMRIVLAAAGIGLLTGLVAGLAPGWRATKIQPVAALAR